MTLTLDPAEPFEPSDAKQLHYHFWSHRRPFIKKRHIWFLSIFENTNITVYYTSTERDPAHTQTLAMRQRERGGPKNKRP